MRSRITALLILASAGACHPAPQPYWGPSIPRLDARPFYGCYRAAYDVRDESRFDNSWFFWLDSLPSDPRSIARGSTRGALHSRSSNEGPGDAWWRPLAGDRFQLYVGDGLHGSMTEFVVRGDSLTGWLFDQTDILPARRGHERVSGRRVSCT